MNEVGIGVIGCGSIAYYHLKRLLELDTARVVTACDINPQALARFGLESGLQDDDLYKNYKRLLKRNDVEAIILCLPNRLHSKVTVDAFNAGKHVYCEKPMATNLSEARKMIEASKKNGKKLMIGLQNRFRGASQALKRHVDNGELGFIYLAKCGWLRRSGIPGWGSWFTRRKDAGAGPILDIGVHVLDLNLWLMSNFEPASAYASSYAKFGPDKKGLGEWGVHELDGVFDVEDLAVAFLKMKNGATIIFEVSWASHISKSALFLKLIGDKAGLDYESATIYTTVNGVNMDKNIHYEERDPYLAAMKHFIDCIVKDEEPITRFDEMLGLQKTLDMILKSSITNRVISAEEV